MTNKILADELAEKIFTDQYFLKLFGKSAVITANDFFKMNSRIALDEKDTLDLLRFADILSHSSEPRARNLAYKVVSLFAEQKTGSPGFSVFATAILAKLGNFPALKYLADRFQG